MPQVLKELFSSEKGLLGIVMLVIFSLAFFLGKITVTEWRETSLYIFGIYVGGKSIQGAASAIASKGASAPASHTPIRPVKK